MKTKDYREVQLSSSSLVFIFIAILILGVVIFLLGVSVGKKQAQILKESGIPEEAKLEETEEKPRPSEGNKGAIQEELAMHQKLKKETETKKPSEVRGESLFYVQVGAFADTKAASSVADKFKKEGYRAFVLDPLPSDNNPVYRVRIGSFPTREQAENIKDKLAASQKKKKSDYFIVRK
jgi:cell division septation protein DedD